MRLSPIFALAALAFALSPLACASSSETDDGATSSSSANELTSLSLTEADKGKTVTVKEGQKVVVKLPSNPSSGFKWVVTSTDRTFGQPEAEFIPDSDAVGSAGTEQFTWKTIGGPLSLVGEHTVKMEYKRDWENDTPAEKTFEFAVRVEAEVFDEGNDCRTNACSGGATCQLCWGSFTCMPPGVLC